MKMVNGTHEILNNLAHYFPEFHDRTEFDMVGFGWFLGWNDGCGQASTDECVTQAAQLLVLNRRSRPERVAGVVSVQVRVQYGQHD